MFFIWCDFDVFNVVMVVGMVDCGGQVENFGFEVGESCYGLSYFDNVNDYQGFLMNGISDVIGMVVVGFGGYQVMVVVVIVVFDNVIGGEVLQIIVMVVGLGDDFVWFNNLLCL